MEKKGKLTERQQAMLEMIRGFLDDNGYPPTVRQIGEEVGISSTSVVTYNLNALERKGYIDRKPDVSRGLRLLDEEESRDEDSVINIPFLGAIAAGEPMPIPDNDFVESDCEYITVTTDLLSVPGRTSRRDLYALRVKGESMIDALIGDGDIVIVQQQPTANNGDTVVAWLRDDKETTLKSFYLEQDRRRVRLQPRNPNMEPIYCDPQDLEIQGKVVGVIRRFD